MKQSFLFFFCLVLCSCEQIVDLDYEVEQKICFNGILDPDSTVHISLYYTRALNEAGGFEPVLNAIVEFFEDGKPWGTATNNLNGGYLLDKKPLVGRTYSVKCNVQGMPPLLAETIVKKKPDIAYIVNSREKYEGWSEYSESTHFYWLNVDYQLNDQPGKDYYWNYHLGWYSPLKKYNFSNSLSYLSPYIDDFNRVVEPDSKLGFYYENYVRMTDTAVDGQVLEFSKEMTTRGVDVFFNADEHYDKYMKSSLQQKMVDDETLPFKEPVQIYSNIENGTGIFGSASFTYLSFRDE